MDHRTILGGRHFGTNVHNDIEMAGVGGVTCNDSEIETTLTTVFHFLSRYADREKVSNELPDIFWNLKCRFSFAPTLPSIFTNTDIFSDGQYI